MKRNDIVRAWKDPAFRASLSPEQRAALPENPAGATPLSEDQLSQVQGGFIYSSFFCISVAIPCGSWSAICNSSICTSVVCGDPSPHPDRG